MNDLPTRAHGAFDVEAWREKLLELNPWAQGLTTDESQHYDENRKAIEATEGQRAFRAARQKSVLERYDLGEEAWNLWATKMLALNKAIEETPQVNFPAAQQNPGPTIERPSDVWAALSKAVFSTVDSKSTIEEAAFYGFIFPGDVVFDGATFAGETILQRIVVTKAATFRNTRFLGDVAAENAQFSNAYFWNATFAGAAVFNEAVFDSAVFEGATFSSEASFELTKLNYGVFEKATFLGPAVFQDADFSLGAYVVQWNSMVWRGS